MSALIDDDANRNQSNLPGRGRFVRYTGGVAKLSRGGQGPRELYESNGHSSSGHQHRGSTRDNPHTPSSTQSKSRSLCSTIDYRPASTSRRRQ